MLVQVRRLTALLYNRSPKPWAYERLYNYENWPVYTPLHHLCIGCSQKRLRGRETIQTDLKLNNTQWLQGLKKLAPREDVEFS